MSLIAALEDYLKPLQILILRRRRCAALGSALARPVCALAHDVRDSGRHARVTPGHCGKAAQGRAVAYLCTGTSCSAPYTRLQDLERAL